MKDGTVYKGKIQVDTEKSILIGNPPYDPQAYLLATKDIEKIIYEEHQQLPPAERKRGWVGDVQLSGRMFQSKEVEPSVSPGLYGGLGFRVHPLMELSGGMEWLPALHAGTPLSVSDGTTLRQYDTFWMYSGLVAGRVYPFYEKKWKTEPYVMGGYRWSHLIPKGSGDSLTGGGWLVGAGALYPLSTHWFMDGRLLYGKSSFGDIVFLGQNGSLNPKIRQTSFQAALGISYRL